MTKGFFRRTWNRYSKLGKGRKKKRVWRRPTGRDNKIRERRKGYPARVSIGYSGDKKLKGKINNKTPVLVNNVKEMERINENQIIIIGKIGKRKKIELIKMAREKSIPIYNIRKEKQEDKNELKKEEGIGSKVPESR